MTARVASDAAQERPPLRAVWWAIGLTIEAEELIRRLRHRLIALADELRAR